MKLLVLVLVLGVCGCGGGEADSTTAQPQALHCAPKDPNTPPGTPPKCSDLGCC